MAFLKNVSCRGDVASYSSSGDKFSGKLSGGIAVNSGLLKRAVDIVLASAALVFFSPFLILCAILVKNTDGGSVLYGHRRVGAGGREFRCLKFRTMIEDSDRVLAEVLKRDPMARAEWAANRKLRNDPRITKIGQFLRETSLDELPQLINVLKGDMSLVGPRPVTADEMTQYYCSLSRQLYSAIRPGITGLWQISGRSELSYDARVRMDCEYVENMSTKLDAIILMKTVQVVLSRRGAH